MNYIIPSLIICLIFYSAYKKNNTFQSFVAGAKTSFQLVIDLFPYLVSVFIFIELFNKSGLYDIVCNWFAPVLALFGIPAELTPLIIIKPFSGSGSIAMLTSIFETYTPDSYISRCAAAIAASSEAVFFISAVYFAKTKVKKLGYAIPAALLANFIGIIFACLICKVF